MLVRMTHSSGKYSQSHQEQRGLYIASRIAYRRGFINRDQLKNIAKGMIATENSWYLQDLVKRNKCDYREGTAKRIIWYTNQQNFAGLVAWKN